jgi:hypothetical protein
MTDFEDFLQKRNTAEHMKARDTILFLVEADKEWERLKEQVRKITKGKVLGTEPFEWAPYPAPYPDYLKLKDVAATFIATAAAGNRARNLRIVFSRRPLKANEMWVDDEPIPAKVRLLDLETTNGIFYWTQKQDAAKWTTEGFANHTAQQLVEYYEAYTGALRAQYPWLSF